MEQVNTTDRLSALRALMKEHNVDIYGANIPLTLPPYPNYTSTFSISTLQYYHHHHHYR